MNDELSFVNKTGFAPVVLYSIITGLYDNQMGFQFVFFLTCAIIPDV